MAVDRSQINDLQLQNLLPKKDTEASSFITKYPEYDGRGVTIAILDTGVDPDAPGLQVTTDGAVKVIDIVDVSGSSDFDTSTVVSSSDGLVTGITGRKLNLNEQWVNPSGEWHIGIVRLYALYPKPLKDRVAKEYKTKIWEPNHNLKLRDATSKLSEYDNLDKGEQNKLFRDELQAEVDILNYYEKKFQDPGPVMDCVVWNNGSAWYGVLDTTFEGNISTLEPMTDYSTQYQKGKLTGLDYCTYSFNIFEDGNILSVVTPSGSHGTHVAGIAAANFSDDPSMNGIAPGAQILAVKIGDSRLSSMETCTSLIRAINYCIEKKVDLINYSYGESVDKPNHGRAIEAIKEAINRYGIIFVSSAGNQGPAISSVGCPGGTTSEVIGVGAYVTPEMQKTCYSMFEQVPSMLYTWSSRGPATDGDWGVDIIAPGGAVTSVPNYTLRSNQLMNGTSMASPNACGSIALVLSGLKAMGITYTPHSIKRAIMNTAKAMGELYDNGAGLLQIDKAFEILMEYKKIEFLSYVKFEVSYGVKERGIYLREPRQFKSQNVYQVSVTPSFPDYVSKQVLIDFCVSIALTCNMNWVSFPSHIQLFNQFKEFVVKINTNTLPPGCHATQICAYDTNNIHYGPLFCIPITVIVPEEYESWKGGFDIQLASSNVVRKFVIVPAGATWCEVLLKSEFVNRTVRVVLHAIYLIKDRTTKYTEILKTVMLSNNCSKKIVFGVEAGKTLELCLTRSWQNTGEAEMLNCNVVFHGLSTPFTEINIGPSDGVKHFHITSSCDRTEDVSINASFKSVITTLRPSEYRIRPLGMRDIFPGGKPSYELVLTYTFKGRELDTVLSPPAISDLLYESEFESQLWQLFDGNKQLIKVGDAYPSQYSEKLEKAMYTVRLQVRHPSQDVLEKLKELNFCVEMRLPNSINIDCFSSRSQCVLGKSKLANNLSLSPNSQLSVYIPPFNYDKLLKPIVTGQTYLGSISFFKCEDGRRPVSKPMKLIVGPINSPKKSSSDGSKKDQMKKTSRPYLDVLKEATIDYLKINPSDGEAIEALKGCMDGICVTFQYYLLNSLYEAKPIDLHAVVLQSNAVIAIIDTQEFRAYIGVKPIEEIDEQQKKELDNKRTYLINALAMKGTALAKSIISEDTVDSSADKSELSKVYSELKAWLPNNNVDSLVTEFFIQHALAFKYFGKAVKLWQKQQDDSGLFSQETDSKILGALEELGFSHVHQHFTNRLITNRYPPSYALF